MRIRGNHPTAIPYWRVAICIHSAPTKNEGCGKFHIHPTAPRPTPLTQSLTVTLSSRLSMSTVCLLPSVPRHFALPPLMAPSWQLCGRHFKLQSSCAKKLKGGSLLEDGRGRLHVPQEPLAKQAELLFLAEGPFRERFRRDGGVECHRAMHRETEGTRQPTHWEVELSISSFEPLRRPARVVQPYPSARPVADSL